MSKARIFLEAVELWNYEHDYSFGKKVAGIDIGELKVNFGGTSKVDVQLPLDGIDPDSDTLVIPLNLDVEDNEDAGISVSIKFDVTNYYAAHDGLLKDLSINQISKVVKYLKVNRDKIDKGLENFIDEQWDYFKRNNQY